MLFCLFSLFHICQIESPSLVEKDILKTNSTDVNFSAAGSEKISIIGQPIHLGDSVKASILIHNEGDARDSVRLEVSGMNNSVWLGDFVQIDSGSSREIFVSFSPLNVGNNEFNWSVYSPRGGVDSNLNGSFNVEVRNQQSLQILSNSYSWTSEEGLKVMPIIFLSEGNSRVISINIFDNTDKNNLLQSLKLSLDHGSRIVHFDLGNPITDNILIEVIPISWIPNISDSKNYSTIFVNPPYTSVEITIDNFYPKNPVKYENISFEYTIINNGNSKINSGLIRLKLSDQTIIYEENFLSLLPDATYSGKIIIKEWKYSYSANLSINFISGDYQTSNWVLIESTNSPEASGLPFDVYAVSYGSIAGLAIVIMAKIIISAISNRTPSTVNNSKLRPPKESRLVTKNLKKQQKREVICPLCEQRLNVPSSHEGIVKCPSCESNFEVQSVEDKSQEKDNFLQEKMESEDIEITIPSSSSSGDMLDCPACEQKLRVLESKRPVRARCPACKCEFMALSEEK
jgi:ribosomal protein L37AE/L43A